MSLLDDEEARRLEAQRLSALAAEQGSYRTRSDEEARRILLSRGNRTIPEQHPLPTREDLQEIALRAAVDTQQSIGRHWQSVRDWSDDREREAARQQLEQAQWTLRRLGNK